MEHVSFIMFKFEVLIFRKLMPPVGRYVCEDGAHASVGPGSARAWGNLYDEREPDVGDLPRYKV